MRGRTRGVMVAAAFVVAVLAGSAANGQQALQPRTELPKETRVTVPAHAHKLVIKFRDGLRVRAGADGAVRSLADADLGAIAALAAQHGATFKQLLDVPGATIQFLQDRAAAASGIAQPDLAAMVEVIAPAASEQALADALNASPLTEWVNFEELMPLPPAGCADASPATPSYISRQTYRGANPGVNMDAAWGLGDMRGAGIKLSDCEYGYWQEHEDLCSTTPEPGQTMIYYQEHGTATLGELGSADNPYGCLGLAPECSKFFFCEWSAEGGSRRPTCIANAVAGSAAGDVVMLEMQTGGAGGGYAPAEYAMSVWTIVKNASDANIIVTAAAGNGSQDLDSAAYKPYRDRGDSGSIIVGAGSSSTAHSKLGFSTYGARVNVQGWGENVTTLGYGDLAYLGGDVNQTYTAQFSGTSSATPIVTGVVLGLQSRAVATLGRRLTPLEMRQLLIDTGIAQGSGGHIGPIPNAHAAALTLQPSGCSPDCNDDAKLDIGDFVCMQLEWQKRTAYGDYDGSGTYTINDFLAFQGEFVKGCK